MKTVKWAAQAALLAPTVTPAPQLTQPDPAAAAFPVCARA